MDDLFDSAHSLEQTFIQEGTKAGRREGMRLGLDEGRQLGLQKGYEIGLEVGQYAGFVRTLRALQQQQPQQPDSSSSSTIPGRIERNLAAMEECLLQFPLYDPLDESIQDLLEALRGKHKAITAALTKQQPGDTPAGQQQQQQDALSF